MYVILLLLCKGILSIARLTLSMSFAKEFLAAPMSKCPQILEFGSSGKKKEKKRQKTCELSLVHFTTLPIPTQLKYFHDYITPIRL